ncbi:hypothetical protein [Planctobacterium marinum]|uniref:Uncharacterized protein n=1 Tax=Planctobacterium marinum TaxID=1631968 RepID=A0AA48KV98_9ALTE|nr:hypothetical protein MACH26_28160 [Planctobacterium marinum]
MQSGAISDLVQQELQQAAMAKVIKKGIFEAIQSIKKSLPHVKYYNSKGKGKKETIQIKWGHYVIEEHEKDKSSRNVVNKKIGTDRRGNNYVKDVDVRTITTHYDYLTVKDAAGERKKFRLINRGLNKLAKGQIVSLGWLHHKKSQHEEKGVIEDGTPFGEQWNDETQPTIFVYHKDTDTGQNINFETVPSEELFKIVHSNSIGWWHLCWIIGVSHLPFLFSGPGGTGTLIIGGIFGGVPVAISVAKVISRQSAGRKMLVQFENWLKEEALKVSDVGAQRLKVLKEETGFISSNVF